MSNEIIVALIISVPPSLVALIGLYYGRKNNKDIREVHLSINSRMDDLLKAAKGESKAEGREIGRAENKSVLQPIIIKQ